MFDVNSIITGGGLLLIGAIVFAETGLLIGFFLPGDTLLFAAGFFAAQGELWLPSLLFVLIFAAIAGNTVGYEIGDRTGKRIFKKKDGILFREEYIERAEAFYEKHGGKTIILARFIPIVRTFAPIVAGVGNMSRLKFFVYNVVGAILWCVSITLLGYWLGSKIPHIDKYVLPVILIVMILTFAPTLFHIIKDPKIRNKILRKKS